jgi:hypothetical protein
MQSDSLRGTVGTDYWMAPESEEIPSQLQKLTISSDKRREI